MAEIQLQPGKFLLTPKPWLISVEIPFKDDEDYIYEVQLDGEALRMQSCLRKYYEHLCSFSHKVVR